MDNNVNKNIDETWKETVNKEKSGSNQSDKIVPPEVDFIFFITTLAAQASIALGNIPNPLTNKQNEDLNQAKFLIDTIDMLKEKTNGNLNEEEGNFLENILYELKMQYISKVKKKVT